MMISQCIPAKNRTYDLKQTLPLAIRAANNSPPVEIVILNYGSTDDLVEYFELVKWGNHLAKGNLLTYAEYMHNPYFHMAHARNLSVLASQGDYIAISSTDIIVREDYFKILREIIERENPVWLHPPKYSEVIVCQRQEFIEAGGYDERFEFNSPEGKDLRARLERRGGKLSIYPDGLVSDIHTPYGDKAENYRIQSLTRTHRKMQAIYNGNCEQGVLTANPEGWGRWTP